MTKKYLIAAVLLSMAGEGYSQRGMLDNSIGVRLGLGNGVTYQHFFTDRNVMELIAYQRFGGANFTALMEAHEQMFDVRGLKWYYGAGGHLWAFNKSSVLQENFLRENSLAFGVDAILGLEFYTRSIPLQFSIDWKPGFNLKGSHYIEWDSGGMSCRYRF
jgi:hypothetical protein